MNEFDRGFNAGLSEVHRQLSELLGNMNSPVEKHTLSAIVDYIPLIPSAKRDKFLETGKCGIFIVGFWTREQMSIIGTLVENMKDLGFSYLEIESTGNGNTGFIFEECILTKNNGPKAK